MSHSECCNCKRAMGSEARVQPTWVPPADQPDGPREAWCPKCFVFHRMLLEPERFNASFTVAANCPRCGWEIVSPGGSADGIFCSHCGARRGPILVRPTPELMEQIAKAVRIAAERHNDREVAPPRPEKAKHHRTAS